jgi:uncharacterized alpha/beta hydrolase family protein
MKSKEFIQGLIEYLKNNLNIPDANFLGYVTTNS